MRDPQVRLRGGPPAPEADPTTRWRASTSRLELDVARAVLDDTAALTCIFDGRGRILLFDRACEELSGFRAEEVLGRGVWEVLVVPEEREIARREIPAIIASGRGAVVEGTWQDAPAPSTSSPGTTPPCSTNAGSLTAWSASASTSPSSARPSCGCASWRGPTS